MILVTGQDSTAVQIQVAKALAAATPLTEVDGARVGATVPA